MGRGAAHRCALELAAGLPGASLSGDTTARHVAGKIRIKVGPIATEFHGAAEIDRDPAMHSGTIHGSGRDSRSDSATRGIIGYRLVPAPENATQVNLNVSYRLTGAQSGKSLAPSGTSLVQRTTDAAAKNQVWRLERKTGGYGSDVQFSVVNSATGQRIAAVDGNATLTSTDGPAARWVLSSTGDDSWTFVNAATGSLLDVVGESREDGARIGLYQATSGANQRWSASSVK